MPQIFEVAVNIPRVSGVFHYHATPELEVSLQRGHMILAPFGKQVVQGIIVDLVDEADVPETRPIHSLLDEIPVLSLDQIALAYRIAEDTLAPLAACIALMLPPGVGQIAETRYALAGASKEETQNLSVAQTRFLNLLAKRGPLRGRQLDKALPQSHWRNTAAALLKKGYLASEAVLPLPKSKIKLLRSARLIDQDKLDVQELGRNETVRQRRLALIDYLRAQEQAVLISLLLEEGGANRGDISFLESKGLLEIGEQEAVRDPLQSRKSAEAQPLILTDDQAEVWTQIEQALSGKTQSESQKPFLLQGVTGSGKTEIYLHAVSKVLERAKSAIILVPEIALTPQTSQRFLDRFPGQVGLFHSQLSPGERFDTRRRARDGDLRVIVGPRSALFTPIQDLGLIVLDESHDDSFYEAGKSPHYHARLAAIRYARITGATCIFGSATPDITSRYYAENERFTLLKLPKRILTRTQAEGERSPSSPQNDLPPVQIVDMRRELKGAIAHL